MLGTFSSVTPYLKFNPKHVVIDNFVFKLHYRWTFIILVVATILVTSRQYVGEHIKCISDTIPSHVINTYCFFTPTFTLVRHMNNSAIAAGAIFSPGIGPFETQDEPIKRHAYYQWVPFVLFAQAICFYIPHGLWKAWEGGRIKMLVFGLRMVGLSRYIKEQSRAIGKLDLPTEEETESRVKDIRRTMIDRMRLNQSWGAHLVFTELLNLINILVQIHLTDMFLGGQFYALGPNVLHERWTEEMDVLDTVFPKVTKCHFHKFGASGSLQMHDTLCVMALNIINEKIYTILWFWYAIVLALTVLGMVWRIVTLFSYKNTTFTKYVIYWMKAGRLDEQELGAVVQKCNFSNWMFLIFLRSNLSEFIFKKIIYHLASEFPDPSRDNTINALMDSEKERERAKERAAFAATAPSTSQDLSKLDEVDTPLLPDSFASKVD